jgi:hypothetical protein
MKWMLVVASGLVFTVGIQLFIFTDQTNQYFAWTINPPLTAAFLGAAYWGSFLLEFLASREQQWSHARIAVPTVLVFTTLTLVATLLHLDKFHLDTTKFEFTTIAATWAWIIVYAIVPPLLFGLLLWQLRVPGRSLPRQYPLPSWARIILTIQGVLMLGLGLAFFVTPENTVSIWPWTLTALTGRAVGAWLLGLGIAAVHSTWENDWMRIRSAMSGLTLFGVLEFIALARYASTPDWGKPSSWVYVVFILSLLVMGSYGWFSAWQYSKQNKI